MKTRRLGRTELQVSELGFGAWGLGGGLWRGVEPRDAQRALFRAMESGVTFVDTAQAYNDGLSETLVGEVVRDLRARDWATVATKIPPLDGRWPTDPSVPLGDIYPPEYVVRCAEQSLRNMKADVLVVEQLHVWHDKWLDSPDWPTLRDTMRDLVKQGKVLHWGISINAHQPASAMRALDEDVVETLQAIYNVFDPSAAVELFPKCRQRDVGIIGRVPFDEGALTGALDSGSKFPRGDWRARYFQAPRLDELERKLEPLVGLVGGATDTLVEMALRFCLSEPALSSVIPGMRTEDHVDQNIAAAIKGTLPSELLNALAEHAWDKDWYAPAPG